MIDIFGHMTGLRPKNFLEPEILSERGGLCNGGNWNCQ